jgi:hypothetical protein
MLVHIDGFLGFSSLDEVFLCVFVTFLVFQMEGVL